MTVDEQNLHWKIPMLDSGCRMLDDQAMADQWLIRVRDKEYGPADIDTLRQWKAEGRLLSGNEARRVDADNLNTAAEIPDLFEAGALAATARRSAWQPP